MSEVVSIVVERQILRARASERVDRDLTREVEELRRLVAEGIDPNTGRPFGGDVQAIFNVALQRNVPSQREAIFTYLGTAPYRSSVGNPDDRRLVTELRALGAVREPRRGEVQTSRTRVRYVAVPVSVGGQRRGAMVVTSDLGAEQAEVDDLIRITGAVTLAVLLLAIGVAWIVAGRVLAPLRSLTETARSITESDLTRRMEVHGDDEIAELARTFNAMLDRLEARLRQPARLRQRRRPRAAHADHDRPRPPRAARRRPAGAARDDRAGHRRARPHDPLRRRPAAAGQGRAPRLPARSRTVELGALTDELLDKASRARRRATGRSRRRGRGARARPTASGSPRP